MLSSDSSDDSSGSFISSSVSLFTVRLLLNFCCMLLRSVFCYRICYSLLQMRGICVGVQFKAPQYLHGRLLKFSLFGLVPNRSILCIGSSLIACFFFVDITAYGIVFVLFFFSYMICFISSNCFFRSCVFSLIIFSRYFLSVIAVRYFEISSTSAAIVLELHSFSI